jgi:hypothetical protein
MLHQFGMRSGDGWEGDLFQFFPQKVAPPEIMIYSAQTITR